MIRESKSKSRSLRLYLVVMAVAISGADFSATGQEATKTAAVTHGLQLLSAQYVPRRANDLDRELDTDRYADLSRQMDTIRYQVMNNAQKAITAFGVEIELVSEGKVIRHFGKDADLLDSVLTQRCASGSGTSWEGAINPGDVFTDSVPANLTAAELKDSTPVVRVTVTGIIWSDGSIEGEGIELPKMAYYQGLRKEDSESEAKVVAILEAHKDDLDIRHRIGEVKKSVGFLRSVEPHVKGAEPAENMPMRYGYTSAVLYEFMQNLEQMEARSVSRSEFEAYSAFFTCRHKQRLAILGSTSAPMSGQ